MDAFAFLFFGTLAVAAIVGMMQIQRKEYLDARAAKQAEKERLEAFGAKCFRPDGD